MPWHKGPPFLHHSDRWIADGEWYEGHGPGDAVEGAGESLPLAAAGTDEIQTDDPDDTGGKPKGKAAKREGA